MTYKHTFDPVALAEYKEAIEWYGEHSTTAMDNFILSVDEKIKDIALAPSRYRITYKKYHEISLKKFPYSIVYLINEKAKTIVITSVYHHKRNPRRKYIK